MNKRDKLQLSVAGSIIVLVLLLLKLNILSVGELFVKLGLLDSCNTKQDESCWVIFEINATVSILCMAFLSVILLLGVYKFLKAKKG